MVHNAEEEVSTPWAAEDAKDGMETVILSRPQRAHLQQVEWLKSWPPNPIAEQVVVALEMKVLEQEYTQVGRVKYPT